MKKYAIIIGAGPAGLTAAQELLKKTDIKPIIFESSSQVGGISKTIDYKGNRIDIGGHRFFSKSDKVIQWWLKFLPLQGDSLYEDLILNDIVQSSYMSEVTQIDPLIHDYWCDSTEPINLMLIRRRISRIFFNSKFFDYPVSLNKDTIFNLGSYKIIKIALSYIKSKLHPKDEISLENFFINRFGRELYQTFFKEYTEKVWGVPCDKIKPEWGSQRIKGLSITKTVIHALKQIFISDKSIKQKNIETSLIEQFMYPKLGPGQLWERVANHILQNGAEIYFNKEVCELKYENKRIIGVTVKDHISGTYETYNADYIISSMPVKDLINALSDSNLNSVPSNVRNIANKLQYRDFITVGLLLKKLKVKNQTKIHSLNSIIPDNWIYIQENYVKLGRLQIFNNWSPYMVKDRNNVWLGLEYFCNEGDGLWSKTDEQMKKFAADELHKLGFIEKKDVLDGVVIKIPKAYPAYFGSYEKFDVIKDFTDSIENLFLIGRNGMHRYNNMDHSMLTAMEAVKNIINGKKTKDNIWNINSEEEYHEMTAKNGQ